MSVVGEKSGCWDSALNEETSLWLRVSTTSDRMVDPHHKREKSQVEVTSVREDKHITKETQNFMWKLKSKKKTTGRRRRIHYNI